jgi:Lhr-like helicase
VAKPAPFLIGVFSGLFLLMITMGRLRNKAPPRRVLRVGFSTTQQSIKNKQKICRNLKEYARMCRIVIISMKLREAGGVNFVSGRKTAEIDLRIGTTL